MSAWWECEQCWRQGGAGLGSCGSQPPPVALSRRRVSSHPPPQVEPCKLFCAKDGGQARTHTNLLTVSFLLLCSNPHCRSSTWGDPHGGDSVDVFQLSPCGRVMTHHTDMSIRATGERTRYK